MTYTNEELEKAHEFSVNNRPALEAPQRCGCFYCDGIFDSTEIKEWIKDKKGTALCPRCGIDSVIGESSGYQITSEFLKAMKSKWF